MADTLAQVLAEARPVAERFAAAGFRIYLVGGIVRDLELGGALAELDFDLTTDARPADIKRIVDPVAESVWTQGERFGTIGCRVAGRPFEITTHRAEWYDADSRKPGVTFGDDVEIDLSRRDFTVNAMARELPEGALVDPFDGRAALDALRLETPIDPAVSFSDDPLRILRAARFIARYRLEPTEDLATAARALVDRLEIVSVERIRDEYDKLLDAERPSRGLRFLADVGAIEWIFRSMSIDAVPALADELDRAPVDRTVRRALTFSHVAADDRAAQVSALRYSNAETALVQRILDGVDRLATAPIVEAGELRRLVVRIGLDDMASMFTVATLRGVDVGATRTAFDALAAAEDLEDLEPAITGGRIIAELGMEPGPAVGEAMDALRLRRLDHGPIDADAELDWLRQRS